MKIVYEIGNSQTWQYDFRVILRGHNRLLQGKIQLGLIFELRQSTSVAQDWFLGHRYWLLKLKSLKLDPPCKVKEKDMAEGWDVLLVSLR